MNQKKINKKKGLGPFFILPYLEGGVGGVVPFGLPQLHPREILFEIFMSFWF